MRVYRIYTEDINRDRVHDILDTYFASYTVYAGTGVCRSTHEQGLIIEVIDSGSEYLRPYEKLVYEAARAIKAANAQEAVFVTSQEIKGGWV